MSRIIISVAIPEGIVLAADSRQTYTNARGNAREAPKFGSKVFQYRQELRLLLSDGHFCNLKLPTL